MFDSRIEKLADLLVNYCAEVKPGQWVGINSQPAAEPLLNAVVKAVIKAGGNPTVNLELPEYKETLLKHGTDDQIRWYSPLDQFLIEHVDVSIYIDVSQNTNSLNAISAKKMMIKSEPEQAWFATFLNRSEQGALRWVYTLYPCAAFAQQAEMSVVDYEDFVFSAMGVDQEDPLGYWLEFHHNQQKLIDWLQNKDEVVVKGKNVDLRLSIKDRIFINSDGKENMPSGEIFTGPVEDSVQGWMRFTYPAVFNGQSVENVVLRFENGKVVEATADKGQDYLNHVLDTDEGARYLGEFAFGTNQGIKKFSGNILFDEKIGGSMHVAVGAGYPKTGSRNQSGIHWDFICDTREDTSVWVDGELFYRNGEFLMGL